MEIIEIKVQVDKSQLDSLQQEVAKIKNQEFTIKFNVTGLEDIKNLTNAQARAAESANKLAIAQANAAAAAQKAAASLATQQEKTQQSANKLAEAQVKAASAAQKIAAEQQKASRTAAQQSQAQQQAAQSALQLANAQQSGASSAQSFASGQESVRQTTQAAGQAIEQTSTLTNMLGDSLTNVVAKMAVWQLLGSAISAAFSAVKDALSTMQAVDDQLVTVRKVTQMSESELAALEQQAYKTASAYGVAADQFLESVAEFARAGYDEQSSALAELATKTQIVGDTTAEVANQFLLAVDAAYQYEGSIEKLSAVLDGMNEIDNNYATSIEKIAEGLGKVAPIASQVHVGIDELSAALGTITAVTQRSGEEAATALRALFLNIVGDTKTEIDEGVTWTTGEIAGLQDLLKTYAADAYEAAAATGSVIDPMEAIAALSQSMKDGLLTEQELMETVSDIGGKLRTSQLLALIQNWDMYESMLADYKDAAGSADKEIENAMDSWNRKVEVLKNTWTEFVNSIVETDAIKNSLDTVTNLLDTLNDSGFAEAASRALQWLAALKAIQTFLAASGVTRYLQMMSREAVNTSNQFLLMGSTAKSVLGTQIAGAAAVAAAAVLTAKAINDTYLASVKEKAEADAEAAESANDAAASVLELYAKYDSATEGTAEFKAAALELAQALGMDVSQGVDTLIGKLNELTEAEIKAAQGSAAAAKASAENYLESTANNAFYSNKARVYGFYDQGLLKDNIATKYSDVMSAYEDVVSSDAGMAWMQGLDASAEQIEDYYNKLVNLKDIMEQLGATQPEIFDSKMYSDVTTAVDYLTESVNAYKAAIESTLEASAMAQVAEDLKAIDITDQDSFDAYIQGIRDSTDYSEQYKQILIEIASGAFPEFSGAADDAGDALEGAASAADDAVGSFENLMSTLKGLADDLSTVQTVFEDFADDGALTFSTLAEVADAFGELNNISEYINLLAQAGNTAADVQQIMAQMTVALLEQKVAAGELTAADYTLIAAMLSEAGVADANTVAMQILYGATLSATEGVNAYTAAATGASGAYIDTSGTVSALYAAGNAGYYAAQGIYAYKAALSSGSVSGGSVATGSANGVTTAKKKVDLTQSNLKDGGSSKPSLSAIGKTKTTTAAVKAGESVDLSSFWNEAMQNIANGTTSGGGGSGGGGGGGGGGGSGSSSDPWESAKESLEDYLDEAERAIEVHEREGASLEDLTGEYDNMMGEIDSLMDEYRDSTGVKEDDFINQLKLMWWDYYDTVQEVIAESNSAALATAQSAVDSVLEAARAATSSSSSSSSRSSSGGGGGGSSSSDDQEEIERLKKALESAKNERTVRYYNAATGQWEWMADQEAVQDAEEDLANETGSGSSGGGGGGGGRSGSSSSKGDDAYDEFETAWNKAKAAVEDGSMTLREAYDYMAEVVANIADKYSVDLYGVLSQIATAFDLDGELAVENFNKTWEEVQAAVESGAMTSEEAFTEMASQIREIGIKYSTDLSDQLQSIANALGLGANSIIEIVGSLSGISFAEGATEAEMTETIIDRMKSNSSAWHTAETDEQRNTYVTENNMLGAALGWTKTNGVWYTSDGTRAYDTGGVLKGLGGIKATRNDEMVLGPELTDKLLNPVEDSRFNQACAKLEYLFGGTNGATSILGSSTTNKTSNDHYGDVYNLPGGITITGKQAETMTLAQLVKSAGGLGIYKNA